MRRKLKKIILSIAILFTSTLYLHAVDLLPPPDADGFGDNTLIQGDSIHINKHVMGEGNNKFAQRRRVAPLSRQVTFGARMYYSEYVKIYTLPLGFNLNDDLVFNLNVPYVSIEYDTPLLTFEAEGLGDITAGVTYTPPELVKNLSTSLDLSMGFPTGKVDNVDKGQNIPLGSGAFSSYVFPSISYKTEIVRVFGEFGYGFFWNNPDYDVEIVGVKTHYNIEKGKYYSGMFGLEFKAGSKFLLSVKGNYVLNTESKVEDKTFGGITNYGAGDYLKTSDVILGVKYYLFGDYAISGAVLFPAYTKYDASSTDTSKRKIGFSFGVSTFM